VLWVIGGYKRHVSPLLPPACRFVPSCSEYAYEAVERYGLVRGGGLAAWRVLRCNPWGGHGYDPVPALGVAAADTDATSTGAFPVAAASAPSADAGDAPGLRPHREGHSP